MTRRGYALWALWCAAFTVWNLVTVGIALYDDNHARATFYLLLAIVNGGCCAYWRYQWERAS